MCVGCCVECCIYVMWMLAGRFCVAFVLFVSAVSTSFLRSLTPSHVHVLLLDRKYNLQAKKKEQKVQ